MISTSYFYTQAYQRCFVVLEPEPEKLARSQGECRRLCWPVAAACPMQCKQAQPQWQLASQSSSLISYSELSSARTGRHAWHACICMHACVLLSFRGLGPRPVSPPPPCRRMACTVACIHRSSQLIHAAKQRAWRAANLTLVTGLSMPAFARSIDL